VYTRSRACLAPDRTTRPSGGSSAWARAWLLAPQGIRVNAISPGLLNTQIWQDLQSAAPSPEACLDYWKQNIPIGRVIEPEEIGELAAFLLCDRSAAITGANLFADGGMTSQLVSKEPYASKVIEGR
jgi:NAD(P)-dependent dehydrogenase (short-subunit alcohol dehydrogenase family)